MSTVCAFCLSEIEEEDTMNVCDDCYDVAMKEPEEFMEENLKK